MKHGLLPMTKVAVANLASKQLIPGEKGMQNVIKPPLAINLQLLLLHVLAQETIMNGEKNYLKI